MPLRVRGHLPASPLAVAIVGSRRATSEGMELAAQLAAQLVERDVVVVSGGAIGIDAGAHRGALAAGGTTLAVMGTGVDQSYPDRHRDLFERIVARGGALVSMFPDGTPPRAGNFVARNAVISALSQAVVVVEAQAKSGSLTTARWARQQGRLVCALRGTPGTNQLLAEGASLVRDGDEILATLAGIALEPTPVALDREQARVLAAVPFTSPADEETIAEAVGLPARVVVRILGSLLLAGVVMTAPGRRYVRSASTSAEPPARGSRGQHPN
jgi:DNA processing protein